MRVEPVESLDDPRVADYHELPDPTRRRDRGIFVAEGRLVVRRLLASRFPARSVLATASALEGLRDLLEPFGDRLPIYLAAAPTLRAVVGVNFHRGCLAVGDRSVEPALDGLVAAGRTLVLLEGVSNPDNVGGVFRNALAFGADAVVLSPGCGDPLYRKALRVSMGAALLTPFVHLPDWPGGLARLRAAGFTLIALTPDPGAVDITELGRRRAVPDRVALLLGAEGEGLGPAARAAADLAVRIDIDPRADSLNVATAAGIALHHLRQRW